MKLIDAHCHLQDNRIFKDSHQIITDAAKAGVKFLACCATSEKDRENVKSLSLNYESVIPFYGIHPWFIDTASPGWQLALADFLKKESIRLKDTFLPGVGETGIDFLIKNYNRPLQEKVLTDHLILAKELKLPISIHVRKAWDSFIHIIKKIGKLPAGGLIHSYSGSADMIPLFEKHGLYISFSGAITRPNAKKAAKALIKVSENRMLLETDSPDILPTMEKNVSRSRCNKPENLVFIADIASQIRKIPVQEYAEIIFNNGVRLFNISEK